LEGNGERKKIEKLFFVNLDMVKNDNSFQNQGDNKRISQAHGGRGLRGRVLKKRKERQVMNK